MVLFFKTPEQQIIAVDVMHELSAREVEKLSWLFGRAQLLAETCLDGWSVGRLNEIIIPWSTNAGEISHILVLVGISRIEEYFPVANGNAEHDPMLQRMYDGIDQKIFEIDKKPDPIVYIDDIVAYNAQDGLA